MSKRNASHAGSWYSSSRKDLATQLQSWLDKAEQKGRPSRAIIAPHAGYTYCGACGAHAYKQIPSQHVRRIFILGPSHHVSLPGCALTQTSLYETPLYDLKIDKEINEELLQTGLFDVMSLETDEDEHSIEMQLPYLAKAMESTEGDFTIVPILVGSTNPEKEETYGRILSKYMDDPSNFFIISSDFCHWGKRFRYTYYDKKYKHIYQSIEALDKMGMDLIEQLDVKEFQKYLSTYGNTICGRHPIGIFLNTIQAYRQKNPTCQASFQFHSYAQSNRCRESGDSSVSYAAGSLTLG